MGRSLKDYRKCGAVVESSAAILSCSVCGDEVALTPYGVKMLADSRQSAVICNPCALAVAPRVSTAVMSPHASGQLERNAGANERLNELLRRMGGKV
jgi:hypothetical protein